MHKTKLPCIYPITTIQQLLKLGIQWIVLFQTCLLLFLTLARCWFSTTTAKDLSVPKWWCEAPPRNGNVTFSKASHYLISGTTLLHTTHIHWHFIGSWLGHCAPFRKAIDGDGVRVSVERQLPAAQGERGGCTSCCGAAMKGWEHSAVRWGETVVRMVFTVYLSIQLTFGARRTTYLESYWVASLRRIPQMSQQGQRVIVMETLTW